MAVVVALFDRVVYRWLENAKREIARRDAHFPRVTVSPPPFTRDVHTVIYRMPADGGLGVGRRYHN